MESPWEEINTQKLHKIKTESLKQLKKNTFLILKISKLLMTLNLWTTVVYHPHIILTILVNMSFVLFSTGEPFFT